MAIKIHWLGLSSKNITAFCTAQYFSLQLLFLFRLHWNFRLTMFLGLFWLTRNKPLIQLWCARSKLNMDEIFRLNIHLWYVDIPQFFLLKSLHAQKRSFLLLICKSVLFYVAYPFIRNSFRMVEFKKKNFLDHFSSSILVQKYEFQVHIPFWPGTPKLDQWRIRC